MLNYKEFETEVCVCAPTPAPEHILYYELIMLGIGSGIFCYIMGFLVCIMVGIVRGARTAFAEVIYDDGDEKTSRPWMQEHLGRSDWQRGRIPYQGPRSSPIYSKLRNARPNFVYNGPQWLPSDENWDL